MSSNGHGMSPVGFITAQFTKAVERLVDEVGAGMRRRSSNRQQVQYYKMLLQIMRGYRITSIEGNKYRAVLRGRKLETSKLEEPSD